MASDTFLWHDYETFGVHPAVDRPSQFGAVRTDTDLQPIGDRMRWYCQPPRDLLPHPAACIVTGITPQEALQHGLPEPEFAERIHQEMMEPGTCSVGYNNLNFDDEVSRHLFYRNFFDPYEREYSNGNSRFDLINLTRMCYALRPDGIQWPTREDGAPSFRLEHLTAANGIEHGSAHDALADVDATLAMARLLRQAQPRLWQWALSLRDRKVAERLLAVDDAEPVVHTSGRIPAARGATTLVLPLAAHPEQNRVVIVFDLMSDPQPLLELSAQDIADRVFVSQRDLPDGVDRIPLKLVRTNKSPALAPMATLKGADPDRIGLDPGRCLQHAMTLKAHAEVVRGKLLELYARPYESAPATGSAPDPELSLYAGFISNADRRMLPRIRSATPQQLMETDWKWQDPRMPELLRRYLARHHWDLLDDARKAAWKDEVARRLECPPDDRILGWEGFHAALSQARAEAAEDAERLRILDQVEAWSHELLVPAPDDR